MVEAYCTKCRAKRTITNPVKREYLTQRGTKLGVTGTCPVCSAKVSTIVKKADYDAIPANP